MGVISVLLEILGRPSSEEVLSELMMFMAPLWISVIVGVLVGWMWKPKWVVLDPEIFDFSASKISPSASSASTADFVSIPSLNCLKFQLPSCISWTAGEGGDIEPTNLNSDCSSSHLEGDKSTKVGRDSELYWLRTD